MSRSQLSAGLCNVSCISREYWNGMGLSPPAACHRARLYGARILKQEFCEYCYPLAKAPKTPTRPRKVIRLGGEREKANARWGSDVDPPPVSSSIMRKREVSESRAGLARRSSDRSHPFLHFLSACSRSHCSPLPPSSLLRPAPEALQRCILPCWLSPRILQPDLAQRIAAAPSRRRKLIVSDSPHAAASILFHSRRLQATCLCTSSRATARQRARTPTCRSRRTHSSTAKRPMICRN